MENQPQNSRGTEVAHLFADILNTVLWWVDPAWTAGAHQSCSITSLPQLDRGEKI